LARQGGYTAGGEIKKYRKGALNYAEIKVLRGWAINSDGEATLKPIGLASRDGPIQGDDLDEITDKIAKVEGASIDLQKFGEKALLFNQWLRTICTASLPRPVR
jgi:hypothetical protein